MTERQHLQMIKIGAIAAALFWTVLLVFFVVWHIRETEREVQAIALAEARMALAKDILYRRWVTNKGGIYAPMDSHTPPNPNLAHLPERDITTPSGRRLTLVNPAYMTRQVFEFAKEYQGPQGHITSLHPMHEANRPDAWEQSALRAFSKPDQEISTVQRIGNQRHLRLIQPFAVDGRCAKCHAAEGYKPGDIRGGISVSIPLEPLEASGKRQNRNIISVISAIWLAGLLVIAWSGRRLVIGRRALEEANRILTVRVEEEVAKNREKDALLLQQARAGMLAEVLVNISHQWRQPLNNIALLVQQQEFLQQTGETDPEHDSHHVQQVLEILKKLSRTIDDFSRLYRTNGIPVPVMPSTQIRQIMQVVQSNFAERGIEIELQVETESAITCLPEDLAQSIINILNNARDAIVARDVHPGRIVITITAAERPGINRIVISDNGGGIPAELLPKIFDPYVTSKFQAQGVGLGLFIVRQLVEQSLHGSISARNCDNGAEFIIEV